MQSRMDYNNLSKDDLVRLLKERAGGGDGDETPAAKVESCHFCPSRGKRKKCEAPATTEYGYCMRHSRTVQAKNAKKEYDLQISNEVEAWDEPDAPEDSVASESDSSERGPANAQTMPVYEAAPEPPPRKPLVRTRRRRQKARKSEPAPAPDPDPEPESESDSDNEESVLTVRKNKRGRYVDPKSGLAFSYPSYEVYGFEDSTGALRALTKKHIKICEKEGFSYRVYDDSDFDDDENDDDEDDEEEEVSDEEEEFSVGEDDDEAATGEEDDASAEEDENEDTDDEWL